MKLTLQRDRLLPTRTFGRLIADGTELCKTLEDAVREIPGKSVATWKIKGETAIPTGEYRITLDPSPRFGPQTLTVNDVPGFVGVRMHAGNTEADTEGCPLLGFELTDSGIKGGTSRAAVDLVRRVVIDAIARGEVVLMDVRNP